MVRRGLFLFRVNINSEPRVLLLAMTLDNIEEKIKKLLRLAADNPNVNEASAAFARATALATRHMLDLDSIDTSDPEQEAAPRREVVSPVFREIEAWRQRVGWKMTIAQAVGEAHLCLASWASYGLYLHGQPDDITAAEMLYNQITHQAEGISRQAVRSYAVELTETYGGVRDAVDCGEATPRTFGRNFRIGLADAIRRRTKTARQEAETVRAELEAGSEPPSTALVRVDNALAYVEEVTTTVATFFEKETKGKGTSTQGASGDGGYAEGRAAGRDVNMGGTSGALGDGS